jgi:hypothetical protein
MDRLKTMALTFCLILSAKTGWSQPLPPPVNLPVQNIRQETSVWCWAAVAQQIVLASRGPQNTPPQCALVAIANGAPPQACCGGYNPACVRPGSIPQIQSLIAHFGGRYSAYAPPTDPLTLYRTLASGRAVILQVSTGQQVAHVVVVRGMAFQPTPFGVQPVLFINDPMSVFTQPVPFARIAPIWMSAIVVH